MDLRKASSKFILIGLSAFLLFACGLSWAQKEEEKGKNQKTAPRGQTQRNNSRPANNAGNRAGAGRETTPSRPANTENRNVNRNTNENRNANAGNRPATNNANRRNEAGNRPAENGGRPAENFNRGGAPAGRAAANSRPSNGFGPTRTVSRGGFTANVAAGGRVTTIRGNNLTVNNYGPRGGRTVIATRPGGVRVVSFGGRAGFVDHPFVRGGVPFMTRTYVGFGGRPFAAVYMGVSFHGALFYHYVPAFRFAPAFYLWAWHPWAAPIRFGWGWGPWFGFYGYYFQPYPVYANASLWLTDYILAENLQAAYSAQQAAIAAQAAAYPPPPPPTAAAATPLSPELKQAIADEVAAQLAEQQQQQAPAPGQAAPPVATPNSMPGALDPKIRTFIVNTGMNETLTNGTECPLAPGDVLTRIDDTPDAQGNVHVLVSSSQANDCASGSQILMSAQTLQDMHNAFQQQIDGGLTQLSQSQGKNGIPTGPAANPTAVPDGTAQPDAGASAELQQTNQQAQQAESQVQGAAQ